MSFRRVRMIIMLRMPETNGRGRVISTAHPVFCAARPPIWLPPVRTGCAAASDPFLGIAPLQLLWQGCPEGYHQAGKVLLGWAQAAWGHCFLFQGEQHPSYSMAGCYKPFQPHLLPGSPPLTCPGSLLLLLSVPTAASLSHLHAFTQATLCLECPTLPWLTPTQALWPTPGIFAFQHPNQFRGAPTCISTAPFTSSGSTGQWLRQWVVWLWADLTNGTLRTDMFVKCLLAQQLGPGLNVYYIKQ